MEIYLRFVMEKEKLQEDSNGLEFKMADFLYIYKCNKCCKYLSIPLRNIDLDSETKTVYEQFHDILKDSEKGCIFCPNKLHFSNIEFPVKYWNDGEAFLQKNNNLISST